MVRVVSSDGVVASAALEVLTDAACETGELQIQVPAEVGAQAWSIVFPGDETDESLHEESALPVHFETIPHACSLAVWDVPSPVSQAGTFDVKVGVRCAVGCQLAGAEVEVRDERGTKVGDGILGDTAWPGTDALHWAVIGLSAPERKGVQTCAAVFAAAGTALPHEPSTATFSFRTDTPCEHRASVRVTERDTDAPVVNVEVRCGSYRASTDAHGVAGVMLPDGTFDISIRKDGFQAQPLRVVIDRDVSVDIEAARVPTRAEMADRAFKDYPWG